MNWYVEVRYFNDKGVGKQYCVTREEARRMRHVYRRWNTVSSAVVRKV